MPGGIQNAQEYLVKLGVQLDYANMAKLTKFLESNTVKAAALGAGLTALGAVIYNFVKSQVQLQQSYEDLAKKQNKSIETVRAEQQALKAMGKTMDEINKDAKLKKIYDDIVKINKEMALPSMDGVMKGVEDLQAEWPKLKSVIGYGLQWLNYHILKELKSPLDEILGGLRGVRDWVSKNMHSWSRTLSIYIGDFVRGITGIGKGAKYILDAFNALPGSVRAAVGAIAGLTILNKSGPLGWLITAITFLGDLRKDYENYEWNKANPDQEQIDVGLTSIWDIIDMDDATISEKIDMISGVLSDALQEAFGGQNIIQIITKSIEDHQEDLQQLGQAIWKVFNLAMKGANTASNLLVDTLRTAFGGESGEGSEELGAAVMAGITTGSFKKGLIGGLISAIANALSEAGVYNGAGELESVDMSSFASLLIGNITDGIREYHGTARDILNAVLGMFTGPNADGEIDDFFGSIAAPTDAFITGLTAWLVSGNISAGIGGMIIQAISDILDHPQDAAEQWIEFAGRIMQGINWGIGKIDSLLTSENGQALGEAIGKILFGEENEFGEYIGGLFGKEGIFDKLGQFFAPIGDAIRNAIVDAFVGLWDALQPYLSEFWYHMLVWIQKTNPMIADWLGVTNELIQNYGDKSIGVDKNGKIVTGMEAFTSSVAPASAEMQAAYKALYDAGYINIGTKGINYAYLQGNGVTSDMMRDFDYGIRHGFDDELYNILDMLTTSSEGGLPETMEQTEESMQKASDAAYADAKSTIKEANASEQAAQSLINAAIAADDFAAYLAAGGDRWAWTGSTPGFAFGDRFDRATGITIGENGPEYAIPTRFPRRAGQLLRQMVGEMGSRAGEMFSAMGVGGDANTIGGSLSAGMYGGGLGSYVNNVTVSAPVTINVTGTGDAEGIGRAAYDASERYLAHTLQGVIG